MQRLLLALTLCSVTGTASASDLMVRSSSGEIGLTWGGLFFLNGADTGFKDTFTYRLDGTFNFTRVLGLKLGVDVAPREVNGVAIYELDLQLVLHPIIHRWWVPWITAGPGFAIGDPSEGSLDVDPVMTLGVGFDLYPWEQLGFRVGGRYLARIGGEGETTSHEMIASAGLFIAFGGEEKPAGPVLLDTDGDGFLDEVDVCPTVPGVDTAKGCPDADRDTLTDAQDACPEEPGPVDLGGCPDGDGDRIVNRDDRCPTEPGLDKHKGCPDADGDEVVNLDDRCPKIPGDPQYQGCPPPPPPEIIKKYSGVIAGINFEFDSDVILASSFLVLDDAARVLTEYTHLVVLIEGHTSSEGERVYNLDLSRRRAESVKRYLSEKGVDAERLQTVGFGPDRPIADEATKKGREQNRRIEFKIVRQ
jgi:OOP family OmpA-OmpF porin